MPCKVFSSGKTTLDGAMPGADRHLVACRGENVSVYAPPRVEWIRSGVDTSVNAARTSARATSAPRASLHAEGGAGAGARNDIDTGALTISPRHALVECVIDFKYYDSGRGK
jgi:hypothetical protein